MEYKFKGLPTTAMVVAIYPAKDFLKKFPSYKGYLRFQLFETKGYDCVGCPDKGTIVIMWIDSGGGSHVDVFSKRKMITMDHIYPKSLGGAKTIENLQPMCTSCNGAKSNKVLDQ